ncbi:MAG: glycosyltransferase family 4 protein [Lachnospiraceae bacterium]|nr:glycosyltransferase family 4 protein [Lachnospiraceae bacterium]
MRILFLFQVFDYRKSTIYLDLVRECRDRGHQVTVIAGTSDTSLPVGVVEVEGIRTVYMKLPDQFGAGAAKKAMIQMSIPGHLKMILKDGFKDETFDIIAYPTPPITLAPVLKYCAKHYKSAVRYLMLKDIFPQNAVDLKMFSSSSPIYKYYRRMEKQLYEYSDRIGCMSEANIAYLKEHDPEIPNEKLEYFPNTVALHEVEDKPTKTDGNGLRIVFGGNMGKPQDIAGLLKGIKACGKQPDLDNVYFYFVGDGSESALIEEFVKKEKPINFNYRHQIERPEYEKLLINADAGLISLSKDFTIPNFPSRILSYMQISKPVMAVLDDATDMDECIAEAGCGISVKAGDKDAFIGGIRKLKQNKDKLKVWGENGRKYLERYLNVGVSVDILERAYRG